MRKPFLKYVFPLLASLSLLSNLDVSAAPTSAKPISTDSDLGIEEYRLHNGLSVLLARRTSAPVVTVNVIFRVGSRNEAVGYTGSTHFLEHLMFKGTTAHDPLKGTGLDDVLKKVGGINNATTYYDRTNYFEVVPRDSLALCLEIEGDRMRHLLLRDSDRKAEMTVVRNELERGEDEPSQLLENMTFSTAFREHPYHHPVIGWRSDVEGVPLSRLRQFYNDFYYPNNATLVIAGDFDREKTLALIEKYFGKIAPRSTPFPKVYTTEPKQEGERRFIVTRGKDLPKVTVAFHTPRGVNPATYPLDVAASILGDHSRKSSRLYKSLVETGLCSEVYASNYTLLDPALCLVTATVQPGKNPKQVEAVILAELKRLVDEPVSDYELALAKASISKKFRLSLSDPMGLVQSITEGVAVGDWHWWAHYPLEVQKVTAASVEDNAKKTFLEDNRTVGYYLPVGTRLAQFPQAGAVTLPAPLSGSAITVAAPEQVKRGAIASTWAKRVEKVVMPNGLTFLLAPMYDVGKLGTIAISGKIRAGDYFCEPGHSAKSNILAELLTYGTKSYAKDVLASKLEEMGASLDFSSGTFFHDFDCEVASEDLSQMISLINSSLREPLLAKSDFKLVKDLLKAKIEEESTGTTETAWNAALGTMYKDTFVYHSEPFAKQKEEIDSTELSEVENYHKRFYNPANCVISLVGDFDKEKVKAMLLDTFKDWEKGEHTEISLSAGGINPNPKRDLVTPLPDKSNVEIVLTHPVSVSFKTKDYLPSLIGNSVLGYDSFACRLAPVRDRYGLTYSISSRISEPQFQYSPWSVELSVNPENVTKATQIVRSIVSDFTKNGITEAELANEKSHLSGVFQVGLRTRRAVARKIAEYEQIGLPISNLDDFSTRISKVTLSQVNESIKKNFSLKDAVLSISGSVKK